MEIRSRLYANALTRMCEQRGPYTCDADFRRAGTPLAHNQSAGSQTDQHASRGVQTHSDARLRSIALSANGQRLLAFQRTIGLETVRPLAHLHHLDCLDAICKARIDDAMAVRSLSFGRFDCRIS